MPNLPLRGSSAPARSFGVLIASVLVVMLAGPAVLPASAVNRSRKFTGPANWPQFGYDQAHTSYNALETTLNVGNVGSMEEKWLVPGPNNGGIAPLPGVAVAGGVAYVGSWDKDLKAYDATTGNLLWVGITDYPVSSLSPAVAHGLVYAIDDNNMLYAFRTSCSDPCSAVWTRGGVGSPGAWFDSPVTVAGSVLYISGYDGDLYSLNATDGRVRWKAKVNVYETDPLRTPPAVDDAHVYVFGDTGVFAYPRECSAACRPLWKASIRITSWNSVAVADGTVFATSNTTLYALDAATGAQLWTAKVPIVVGAPAVGEGVVVTTSRDLYGTVLGFSASGCGHPVCDPIWTATTGSSVFDPTIANGVAFAGGMKGGYLTGSVYAFDLHCSGSCSPLWQHAVIGAVETPVAVANGHVYATTLQADVYSFGLPG